MNEKKHVSNLGSELKIKLEETKNRKDDYVSKLNEICLKEQEMSIMQTNLEKREATCSAKTDELMGLEFRLRETEKQLNTLSEVLELRENEASKKENFISKFE